MLGRWLLMHEVGHAHRPHHDALRDCVKACPKQLISLVPLKKQAVVRCDNCDKGAMTNKVCKVGCIGCMKCQKVCEAGAVKVEHFHATVDPEKCIGCGKCVEACPRHCLTMMEHLQA